MKMYKLEVYVLDFENAGQEQLFHELDRSRYFHFTVQDIRTADVGEWHDDHVLNKTTTPIETYRQYFK